MRTATPALLLTLALALVAGACEFSAEPAVGEETPPPTSRASSPAATAGGAATGGRPSEAGRSDAAASLDPVVFGAWRRASVPPASDLEAAAERACRALPPPVYVDEPGLMPVTVTDMRGQGLLVLVFAAEGRAVGCEVTVRANGDLRASMFRVDVEPPVSLAPAGITVDAYALNDGVGGEHTIAVGRYGEGAAHVRAGFDDDTYTTAAIRDGWWAMWWPGQVRPAVIVAGNRRNEAIGTVKAP